MNMKCPDLKALLTKDLVSESFPPALSRSMDTPSVPVICAIFSNSL